tara:strand:- start:571 stop:921 length:351 start_codon:yes stop_codon:yes gene_type:complete
MKNDNNYELYNSYNLSYIEDSPNIIDNNYYYYLYNINKLFKEKKYKSKIGAKAAPDSIIQTIIYYNPINGNEKYIIKINDKFLINISVPLKNSNYFYNTTLYNIEHAFFYLKMHIY